MVIKYLRDLLIPDYSDNTPPDDITSEEARKAFEAKERAIETQLRWIEYQADILTRMKREHKEQQDKDKGCKE